MTDTLIKIILVEMNLGTFDDEKLRQIELEDSKAAYLLMQNRIISTRCSACHLLSHSRNTTSVYFGAQYVCRACLERFYSGCEYCDSFVLSDDENHLHGENFISSYRGFNKLWSWNENPLEHGPGPTFFKSDRDRGRRGILKYYGVELEVERDNTIPIPPDIIARSVRPFDRGFVLAKRDGSLQPAPGDPKNGTNGFELVSKPGTLRFHKFDAGWQESLEAISYYLQSRPETTGLHVHVDRQAVSAMTVGKVICFVNLANNQSFMRVIADRDYNVPNPVTGKIYAESRLIGPSDNIKESRWRATTRIRELSNRKIHDDRCWHRQANKEFRNYYESPVYQTDEFFNPIIRNIDPPVSYSPIPCFCGDGIYNTSRYEAVNIHTKKDTFEFRIFRGVPDLSRLFACLEFCDSIINFCQYRPIEELLWHTYVETLETQRKQYPYLVKWLVAHNYMKERTPKK